MLKRLLRRLTSFRRQHGIVAYGIYVLKFSDVYQDCGGGRWVGGGEMFRVGNFAFYFEEEIASVV